VDFPVPVELGRAIIIVSSHYAHSDGGHFDFEIFKTTNKNKKTKSNNSLWNGCRTPCLAGGPLPDDSD